MGTLRNKEYYDNAYLKSDEYKKHYKKSIYYELWKKVFELIDKEPILEIGCGSGQFAEMLYDKGIKQYIGFDYSFEAIKIARSKSPMLFAISDALNPAAYIPKYNTVVSMEVFEHTDDLGIIKLIRSGSDVIFTVPDFDYPSHIRHFETHGQVMERYSGLIHIQTYEKFDKWHIVKGVKK